MTKPQELIEAARLAARNAYAPYSNFGVGAAVLLTDGSVVTGANFENASYGLSLCAETVALAAANAQGAAVALDGKMIDRPVILKAERILARSGGTAGPHKPV